MAKTESGWSVYTVPDNFIDEGRIFNGMFRTRYFIEAVLYALVFAFIAILATGTASINTKITCVIIFAGPPFALGIVGINGEPVSKTVSHIIEWAKNRNIMLYDHTRLVLTESPVAKMMSQTDAKDKILEMVEKYRNRRIEQRANQEFVLGKNFQFASDTDYARDYIPLEEFDGNVSELIDVEFDFDDDSIFDDVNNEVGPPNISLAGREKINLDDIYFQNKPHLKLSTKQFDPTAFLRDKFFTNIGE